MAKGQLASRSASDGGRTVALAQAGSSGKPGFLSKLFGGGAGEENAGDAQANAKPAASSSRPAAVEPRGEKPAEKLAKTPDRVAAVPVPLARPVKSQSFQAPAATTPSAPPEAAASTAPPAPVATFELASTSSKPVHLAQAGFSANDIINERGYWQGLPSSEPTSPAKPQRAEPPRRTVALASAAPASIAGSAPWPLVERSEDEPPPNALAYAAQPAPIAAARPLPMGLPRATPADTTIAVKRSDDRPSVPPPSGKIGGLVQVGDRFDDPWIRAMIVSPSAQDFMRTTLLGAPDFRNLGPHLRKPAAAVLMTFTHDPHLGMTCEKFAGSAVVFVSTVAFGSARTAALR
jgi:hypothetical protein